MQAILQFLHRHGFTLLVLKLLQKSRSQGLTMEDATPLHSFTELLMAKNYFQGSLDVQYQAGLGHLGGSAS